MTAYSATPDLIKLYHSRLNQPTAEWIGFQNASTALSRFFTAPSIRSSHPEPRLKRETADLNQPSTTPDEQKSVESSAPPTTSEQSWYARLKQGLRKTHAQLGTQLNKWTVPGKLIDNDLLESLEISLITADVGVKATHRILNSVTEKAQSAGDQDPNFIRNTLQHALVDILRKVDTPLKVKAKEPFVILVVGVNGVGKTTTIGKLAKYYQSQGLSVMLAAGDTFRAAAVEQLQVWGKRNNVPVVAQHTGADSASVIFDAVQSAQAKQIDVVIADTAGRLHNKNNLMEELAKVKRVMQKLDPSAPHETLLILDANTGQNATNQAQQFHESIGLSGLALTKLDGTAKGGIIFALSETLNLPVRFIGVGEGIDDLRPFQAEEFVNALLSS